MSRYIIIQFLLHSSKNATVVQISSIADYCSCHQPGAEHYFNTLIFLSSSKPPTFPAPPPPPCDCSSLCDRRRLSLLLCSFSQEHCYSSYGQNGLSKYCQLHTSILYAHPGGYCFVSRCLLVIVT